MKSTTYAAHMVQRCKDGSGATLTLANAMHTPVSKKKQKSNLSNILQIFIKITLSFHFGAAARTSLVHLSAYSLKFLLNKSASLPAVASKALASNPFLAQANLGVRTSFGTPLTSPLGTNKPKMGIASHSESGSFPRVPSWMASMMALVYLRLQRSPVPYSPPTQPVLMSQASAWYFSNFAASSSAYTNG